jgi:hypothetical protein
MAAPIQYLGRDAKDIKYRYNWNAPIIWSKHEPNTYYHGSQFLLKTSDMGKTWKEVSPDLTRNEKSKQGKPGVPYTNEAVGAENYGTLAYVMESVHEKAHPDVFNLLLQVLDDGILTDGLGRRVDFRNTIIIMTSNIGARDLKDFGSGIGFSTKSKSDNLDEQARSTIQNALKKAFAPEFINRLDDIIIFNSLERSDLHKIIDLMLIKLKARLVNLGYEVQLTEKAKDFIADKGYDPQYGARPLNRAIQKYLEDLLAEEILKGPLEEGELIEADYEENAEQISLVRKKV